MIKASSIHKFMPLVSAILFIAAIFVVRHEIKVYHWQDIKTALLNIPRPVAMLSLLFTISSYISLFFYDYLALGYVNKSLPRRAVALASFFSFALSHNVGHALFSGGSMRYRLYTNWGISAAAIAKIVIFCAATYIVGLLTCIVVLYPFSPEKELVAQGLPEGGIKTVVLVSSVVLALWWGNVLIFRKGATLKGVNISFPSFKLAMGQVIAACADILLAAAALYVILSHYVPVPVHTFLFFFALSQLAGYLSQVPGGIGVFEGSMMFLISNHFPSSQVLAALIAYRAIYYLFPLVVAGVGLLSYELRLHRRFYSSN